MSAGQKEQAVSIGQNLASEMKYEAVATRKMLERLPAEQLTWKPHEKSMTLGVLAGHIVEMIGWTKPTLEDKEMDFEKYPYTPKEYTEAAELVADLDRNIAEAVESLNSVSDEAILQDWTLRNGAEIYFTMPRVAVMRSFAMNHIYHHRGQLSVYLRILDIPVPPVYGPSADEKM
jgi:uncharacterized damage-inducible protein DinB